MRLWRGPGHGFSLVEVAVAGAVLGTAAVMLSGVMSVSNAQKHGARRQALARSLVLRQLEHFQAKVDDSIRPGNAVNVVSSGLELTALRAANQTISLTRVGSSANQFAVQPMRGLEVPAGGRLLLPETSEFHVYTGGINAVTVNERNRISSEQIGLSVFVGAVSISSIDQAGVLLPPDSPYGYTGTPANMRELDLVMVQVITFDVPQPDLHFFSLSRMYRVPTRQLFPSAGSVIRGKF